MAIGDGTASIITGQFSWIRLIGIFVIGATIYALEIPNFFSWLEKFTAKRYSGAKRKLIKTFAVVLFFNPLWIFRHYIFINIFMGDFATINLALLKVATISYLYNIPISIVGNYIIQNKISLKWRFIASSVFSALMALYYALGQVYFQ